MGDEVMANAKELTKDMQGRHVIETALVHGPSDFREQILSELRENFLEHVKNRSGQYVLQKVLQEGEQKQREHLASELLALSDKDLSNVATTYFGSGVLKAASAVSGHF